MLFLGQFCTHLMGVGGYTGTGYVPGCYMKFNLCVNTMYWVFDDRKKIIKSKICIWLWLNFFVFYTFLCDLWFGHFEWFLIFPPWIWHEIWSSFVHSRCNSLKLNFFVFYTFFSDAIYGHWWPFWISQKLHFFNFGAPSIGPIWGRIQKNISKCMWGIHLKSRSILSSLT